MKNLSIYNIFILWTCLFPGVGMSLEYLDAEWSGVGKAKRSEWASFSAGFGDPGNAPDVEGSTAGGVIVQKAIGGTLTGSGNIYNPVGPSDFELRVTQEEDIEELVLQVRSIGALDPTSVGLKVAGEEMPRVPQIQEVGNIPGDFGSTIILMFSWKLNGSGIREAVLSFKAAGSHLSLDGVRMDVLLAAPQVRVIVDTPLHDRWNYNFNAAPGLRPKASIFRAVEDGVGIFRHGTFDLVFDVSQESINIEQSGFSLKSARLHIMTTTGFTVPYDATLDAMETYLPETDSRYVADGDAGRPVELFGLKFNHDLDIESWTESSPFAPAADQPRHVVPGGFDSEGQFRDVSLALDFLNPSFVHPFAIGQIENHASGENIPFDSWMTFDVDLSRSSVAGYFNQALAQGKLGLSITSLSGGGLGNRAFPEFYTKESIEGESPWLELIFAESTSTELPYIESIQVGSENIVLTIMNAVEGGFQIRWSEDLKSWKDVLNPVVETIGAGQVRWTDSTAATHKFYQVQSKP